MLLRYPTLGAGETLALDANYSLRLEAVSGHVVGEANTREALFSLLDASSSPIALYRIAEGRPEIVGEIGRRWRVIPTWLFSGIDRGVGHVVFAGVSVRESGDALELRTCSILRPGDALALGESHSLRLERVWPRTADFSLHGGEGTVFLTFTEGRSTIVVAGGSQWRVTPDWLFRGVVDGVTGNVQVGCVSVTPA
ncbi:MAG: hypothetical protein AB1626_00010 [Candidatus Micrarchaeota archaeon]